MNTGENIIKAIIRASALESAMVTEGGTVFVWSANAAEQLEGAISEEGYELVERERVQSLIEHRDFLRAEIESMRDDIKSALTLIERIKITLIDNT